MGPMPPIVQRVSVEGNIEPQKESLPMGGKAGREGEDSRDPDDLKTELFLRFFHLARRFWNHTCNDDRGLKREEGRGG